MAIVTSQLLRIMTELGFNVSTHTHTNNHTICLGLLRPTQSWNLPWLSKTITQLIKKRNYYFKKAHHSGSSVDYSKFKQLRNKVITELRLAKRRFFSNHNPQNPKEFWKIIRSLSPRESSSHLWRVKISLLVLVWTRPIFWTSPSPTTTIVQFQNCPSLISLKLLFRWLFVLWRRGLWATVDYWYHQKQWWWWHLCTHAQRDFPEHHSCSHSAFQYLT